VSAGSVLLGQGDPQAAHEDGDELVQENQWRERLEKRRKILKCVCSN
jgi:hypothetical protein